MVKTGSLPNQLELLLSNPHICKAGRSVNADLLALQKVCRKPAGSFCGAIDLARLAKERNIVTDISSTTLADLAALVLKRRLDKNTFLRTSESWENQSLNADQCLYAAKDVYASLMVYHEITKCYPLPSPLLATTPAMTPVLIYASNMEKVIASGTLSLQAHLTSFDGINITHKHALVDVQRIHTPGAKVKSHHKRTLKSFGDLPFVIVCERDQLRTYKPLPSQALPSNTTMTVVMNQPVKSRDSEFIHHQSQADFFDHESELDGLISVRESLSEDLSGPQLTTFSNVSHTETHSTSIEEPKPSRDQLADLDFAEKKLGPDKSSELKSDQSQWDHETHSRVLKDPWHLFHMIYLSASHSHRKQFTRELRDAFFIPNKYDYQRLNQWGAMQNPPQSYEKLRNTSPEWTRTRCRHTIPPPHILYPLVRKVFLTYGTIRDQTTKQILFPTDSQWNAARNILDLIQRGYVSDPPRVSLYTQLGIDQKSGLAIYRCARGTNATEEGVHTHIRQWLPKFGVSLRHVQASLLDFTIRHNLLVILLTSSWSFNR